MRRRFGSSWTDQNSLFINLPTDQLLAITAYGEAGGEGGEGMMAVLNVIRNRTANVSAFGDGEIYSSTGDAYKAVILKSKQFSMYNTDDPVRTTAIRIAQNFTGEAATNSNLKMAYDLAQMLVNGQLDDNTGGSDYYFNPRLASPSWAASLTYMGTIGNHVFYKTPGSSYPAPGEGIQLASIIPDLGTVDLSEMGIEGVGPIPITTLLLVGFGVGLLIMKPWKRR